MKHFFKLLWIWFFNLLIAFDQFINALFLGDPDETISSRCGKIVLANPKPKAFHHYFAHFIAWFTALFQKKHVENSIEKNEGGNSFTKLKEKEK
jgi:hypothetical protein